MGCSRSFMVLAPHCWFESRQRTAASPCGRRSRPSGASVLLATIDLLDYLPKLLFDGSREPRGLIENDRRTARRSNRKAKDKDRIPFAKQPLDKDGICLNTRKVAKPSLLFERRGMIVYHSSRNCVWIYLLH